MAFYRDIEMQGAPDRGPASSRTAGSCPESRRWTAFITPCCASLLSTVIALSGCGHAATDYGFRIGSVTLQHGYQRIEASFDQELKLSRDAVQALDNGVPLTVMMEMELRDAATLTLLADDVQRFEIRYLPLSQHYELRLPGDEGALNFPRLRHVLNVLSSIDLTMGTGALAPGAYELRTRTRLDNGRLPAPMRLPALFSAEWQHDSEWSTWPFEINV